MDGLDQKQLNVLLENGHTQLPTSKQGMPVIYELSNLIDDHWQIISDILNMYLLNIC